VVQSPLVRYAIAFGTSEADCQKNEESDHVGWFWLYVGTGAIALLISHFEPSKLAFREFAQQVVADNPSGRW
jgi:hypothetical protein